MDHHIPFQMDHVELFVPDRHDAARWYQRVLGFEILEVHKHWADDPRGPLMIAIVGDQMKLALFQGEPQGARPTAGFHLVACRTDAQGFLSFLARLGELELTDHRGRRVTRSLVSDHDTAFSIYFSDPYGHRLEVTSYDHHAIRATLATGA